MSDEVGGESQSAERQGHLNANARKSVGRGKNGEGERVEGAGEEEKGEEQKPAGETEKWRGNRRKRE